MRLMMTQGYEWLVVIVVIVLRAVHLYIHADEWATLAAIA